MKTPKLNSDLKSHSQGNVTLKDVAERAGVGKISVSVVLNGAKSGTGVSAATRERILQAAQELGYRPNGLARAVSSGKTHVISYLVANPPYEPYWRTVLGAIEEAEAHGYMLKVMSATPETLKERVRQCVELRVAGIVARYHHQDGLDYLYEEANRYNIPVVAVDEGNPQPQGLRVMADDAYGCRLAVEHLVSLGHERILFISMFAGREDAIPGGVIGVRERAFWAEMQKRGLPVDKFSVARIPEEFDPKSTRQGMEAIKRVLKQSPQKPTAIFAYVDIAAITAIRACRSQGLRVPEDVSVVGFSNFAFTEWSDPPLTTVASPWAEMGRYSIKHILERVSNEPSTQNKTNTQAPVHYIAPSFVVRESTAKRTS